MPEADLIRVLLVDDDLDFLDATARALSRRGFEVSVAEDGTGALESARRKPFDVVVLDVRMPGMDGAEVFRELRQTTPALPVIMLTGHGNVQQAYEVSRQGVFEYLTKPCDIDKLVKVARRAYEQTRASAASPGSVRVLLVDDDPEFTEALSITLRRRGFDVTASNRGDEAVGLAAKHAFDVAVVDLVMPEMDGLEVLKRVKRAQPRLEVLMLTGHPSVRQAIEGLADGAFDFLVKPPSIEALVAQLNRASSASRDRPATRLP
jgi:DNA-binding NtrC family response regulator